MGIKHYFMWYKNRFAHTITPYFREQTVEVPIDNFLIDLNGLFHTSAQRVYKYGNYAPPERLLAPYRQRVYPSKAKQLEMFQDVCHTIYLLCRIVAPRKRLVLCVDGPAPVSKASQQRGRRFRAVQNREANDNSFDPNALSPGTKLMDYLTKFIDWYIRKQLSESPKWRHLEIVFSNEKNPGEGEQRIMNYIRKHGSPTESYCIHGLDADIIMLALGTQIERMYILREELYDSVDYLLLDIGAGRKALVEEMKWEGASPQQTIIDFVFLCFMVGNDFLPNIPALAIMEGGIEIIFDIYRNVCKTYGHITKGNTFRPKSLQVFLGTLGQYEEGLLIEKFRKKDCFFPDELLAKHIKVNESDEVKFNFKVYKKEYYLTKFPEQISVKSIAHAYLEGMLWVLKYYTEAPPSWDWYYQYHYAPFASDIAKYLGSFTPPKYSYTAPRPPFLQLLAILPPKSSNLLPKPLDELLTNPESPILDMYPSELKIDLSGKRREWEGIVLLPPIDQERLQEAYFQYLDRIHESELKRNMTGKAFVYKYHPVPYLFRSFYGDIERCCVRQERIEF